MEDTGLTRDKSLGSDKRCLMSLKDILLRKDCSGSAGKGKVEQYTMREDGEDDFEDLEERR